MNPDKVREVLSSSVRFKTMDALSQRPRTLRELAYITGISVQGVIRHLRRLERLGLIEERRLSASVTKARRVYASKGAIIEDYSSGDLTIAKVIEGWPGPRRAQKAATDLEGMSAEILLLRRRVKDETKRLGRSIDEVAESQGELEAALTNMSLSDDERLILRVVLTEETKEDGVRVLSRFYGIEDARSIDKALSKAKGPTRG